VDESATGSVNFFAQDRSPLAPSPIAREAWRRSRARPYRWWPIATHRP